jgi:hypothetical protein
MTFDYLWTLFVCMYKAIDHAHTYDEYLVFLAKSGMTQLVHISRTHQWDEMDVAHTPLCIGLTEREEEKEVIAPSLIICCLWLFNKIWSFVL